MIFMSGNLVEIDSAMDLIKEEIIRDLSESVSKQNNELYFHDGSTVSLPFSDKHLD